MIYNATEEIARFFEENDIKHRIVETAHTSCVEAGFSADNISGVKIRFISTDEHNDVAARILSLVKVPEKKRGAVLEAINELHRKYRYIKFSIDKDDDLQLAYDLPLRTENVGAVAEEIFIRLMQIADDAYPILMKAIWS